MNFNVSTIIDLCYNQFVYLFRHNNWNHCVSFPSFFDFSPQSFDGKSYILVICGIIYMMQNTQKVINVEQQQYPIIYCNVCNSLLIKRACCICCGLDYCTFHHLQHL